MPVDSGELNAALPVARVYDREEFLTCVARLESDRDRLLEAIRAAEHRRTVADQATGNDRTGSVDAPAP